ncbi:hypothetical protein ACFLQW_04905, partial [Candidatus Zixiibacteriota bacterium]
ARECGVYPSMATSAALHRCPELIVVDADNELYSRASEAVGEYLQNFSPNFESPSVDAAYLDLTGMHKLFGATVDIGARINREVGEQFDLKSTIGVAGNKLVSRIASRLVRPAGLCDVTPGSEREFLAPLNVRRLPGIGAQIARRLGEFSIETVGELAAAQRSFLVCTFGKRGEVLYARAQGIDHSPVRPVRRPSVIAFAETLVHDSNDRELVLRVLFNAVEKCARQMREYNLLAGRVVVVVSYLDGHRINGSHRLVIATDLDDEIHDGAVDVIRRLHTSRVAVRRIGVQLSGFSPASPQMTLIEDGRRYDRRRALVSAVDRIRGMHGFGAIAYGRTLPGSARAA